MIKAAGKILASRRLTAGLLILATAVYIAFTFQDAPFPRWIDFLFRSAGGNALCLGLAVNLTALTVRSIRSSEAGGVTAETIRTMDSRTELPSTPGDHHVATIAAWMNAKGFSVTVGENSVKGVKGRFCFLPGAVFRTGLTVLLLALLASAHLREERKAVITEGGEADLFGMPVTMTGLEADLPSDFLQVGEENSFLIGRARAVLASRGTTARVTSGLPVRINGMYCRIVHLGYAQRLRIKSGNRVFDENVMLDILPPGKAQVVSLPGSPQFCTLSLEPVKTISKGLLKGRQYDLKTPLYRIAMRNGGGTKKPDIVVLGPGGNKLLGGTRIALSDHALYATVHAVHDPALAVIYSGFVITLLGVLLMPARFFWFRKEMRALRTDRTLLIGYSEEFFKKWGVRYFDEWKQELSASANTSEGL